MEPTHSLDELRTISASSQKTICDNNDITNMNKSLLLDDVYRFNQVRITLITNIRYYFCCCC